MTMQTVEVEKEGARKKKERDNAKFVRSENKTVVEENENKKNEHKKRMRKNETFLQVFTKYFRNKPFQGWN